MSLPNVSIHIDADHSCNWRCCWGCKGKTVKTPVSKTDDKVAQVAKEKIKRG